ncbi:MAG: hypothetical protein AB1546_16805 [bacterium]
MTVYRLVKMVLDDAYSYIPGSDNEKDSLIRKCLDELRLEYASLEKGSNINYRDPMKRFAYIYKYVTCHANIVYEIIESSLHLSRCFDADRVRISCIGGGPGSDLLGILKYINKNKKCAHIMCYLLDKEELWDESWSDVGLKINKGFRLDTHFSKLDVFDKKSWELRSRYLDADIFTLIYFMSELYYRKEEADSFFRNIFKKARQGTYMLFIDNRNHLFYGWFDELCRETGFENLESDETEFKTHWDEEKRDLSEYYDKFGDPKLKAKIAYRIAKKR